MSCWAAGSVLEQRAHSSPTVVFKQTYACKVEVSIARHCPVEVGILASIAEYRVCVAIRYLQWNLHAAPLLQYAVTNSSILFLLSSFELADDAVATSFRELDVPCHVYILFDAQFVRHKITLVQYVFLCLFVLRSLSFVTFLPYPNSLVCSTCSSI